MIILQELFLEQTSALKTVKNALCNKNNKDSARWMFSPRTIMFTEYIYWCPVATQPYVYCRLITSEVITKYKTTLAEWWLIQEWATIHALQKLSLKGDNDIYSILQM